MELIKEQYEELRIPKEEFEEYKDEPIKYDENSKDIRDEAATYSTNLEVIKDLRDRYFSF